MRRWTRGEKNKKQTSLIINFFFSCFFFHCLWLLNNIPSVDRRPAGSLTQTTRSLCTPVQGPERGGKVDKKTVIVAEDYY